MLQQRYTTPAAARRTAGLFLLTALVGCGDDPAIPHVVYPDQLPPPPPDHVYNVPEWRVGDSTLEFTLADPAQAGWRLGFEGTIAGEPIDRRPGVVLVLIEERTGHGEPVFVNSGGAHADLSGDPFTYSVSLEGPKTAGRYQVSLIASGGQQTAEPIATAELVVRVAEP